MAEGDNNSAYQLVSGRGCRAGTGVLGREQGVSRALLRVLVVPFNGRGCVWAPSAVLSAPGLREGAATGPLGGGAEMLLSLKRRVYVFDRKRGCWKGIKKQKVKKGSFLERYLSVFVPRLGRGEGNPQQPRRGREA